MNQKSILLIAASVVLSSCAAPQYAFEGQKVGDSAALARAADAAMSSAVAAVTPLPAPLTQKKLVVAMPNESTIVQQSITNVTTGLGAPNAVQLEMIQNLGKNNYKGQKVFFEALQKKGIYSSAQLREMPSMAIALEPSADTDVMYYTEPMRGAGQWFFASQKYGRQVFAYDRSAGGVTAKVLAFVDAVQVLAVRE